MATFNVADWSNLTVDAVTNLLLDGQLTTPKEIFDRIVPSIGPTEVVLDMAALMSTGPGRYALPSQAPFVQITVTVHLTFPLVPGRCVAPKLDSRGSGFASSRRPGITELNTPALPHPPPIRLKRQRNPRC